MTKGRCMVAKCVITGSKAAWLRRRGVAAVEFAACLPLLFVVLFGLWEVGRITEVQQVMWNSAREAARDASLGQSNLLTVANNLLTYLQSAEPTAFGQGHSTTMKAPVVTLPANTYGYTCWDTTANRELFTMTFADKTTTTVTDPTAMLRIPRSLRDRRAGPLRQHRLAPRAHDHGQDPALRGRGLGVDGRFTVPNRALSAGPVSAWAESRGGERRMSLGQQQASQNWKTRSRGGRDRADHAAHDHVSMRRVRVWPLPHGLERGQQRCPGRLPLRPGQQHVRHDRHRLVQGIVTTRMAGQTAAFKSGTFAITVSGTCTRGRHSTPINNLVPGGSDHRFGDRAHTTS